MFMFVDLSVMIVMIATHNIAAKQCGNEVLRIGFWISIQMNLMWLQCKFDLYVDVIWKWLPIRVVWHLEAYCWGWWPTFRICFKQTLSPLKLPIPLCVSSAQDAAKSVWNCWAHGSWSNMHWATQTSVSVVTPQTSFKSRIWIKGVHTSMFGKKSRKVRRYMLKSSPLLLHGNTMIQLSNGLHHCPFSWRSRRNWSSKQIRFCR